MNNSDDYNASIEDIEYLKQYFNDKDVIIDISNQELANLYHQFSEEVWAAQWEDNAEGQFIFWLRKKERNYD